MNHWQSGVKGQATRAVPHLCADPLWLLSAWLKPFELTMVTKHEFFLLRCPLELRSCSASVENHPKQLLPYSTTRRPTNTKELCKFREKLCEFCQNRGNRLCFSASLTGILTRANKAEECTVVPVTQGSKVIHK